jgi:hypothetical protein
MDTRRAAGDARRRCGYNALAGSVGSPGKAGAGVLGILDYLARHLPARGLISLHRDFLWYVSP